MIDLKKLSKREKLIFLVTIIVAVAALGYSGIFEPILGRLGKTDREFYSKKSRLKENKRLLESYPALKKEYAQYPGMIEREKNEEEALTKTLSEIERISRETSCLVVSMRPRASKKVEQYKKLFLDVTIEGDVNALSKFLYEIETSATLLKIQRFTITAKPGSSGGVSGSFLISRVIA